MATYNGEKYLQEQLDSFVAQKTKPDELVVSDDCSTDKTIKILKDFAKIAPFDVFIHENNVNLGYTGNFNKALELTTGDIVFLSDQDDVWFQNKIETILQLVRKKPNLFVYMNDALITDEKLQPVNLTKLGQIKSAGLSENEFAMGCCCAIRKNFINIVLPIPTGLKSHDNWLVGIANGLNKKTISKSILQYYRRHNSNESQYIANRVTKVNKWSSPWHIIKTSFTDKSNDKYLKSIEQAEIYILGLEKVKTNAPKTMICYFDEMIVIRQKRVSLLKSRLEVRNLNIFKRIPKALKLYYEKYPANYQLVNLIRDILG